MNEKSGFDNSESFLREEKAIPMVQFEIINTIELDENIVEKVKRAAEKVWHEHFPDQQIMIRIGFYKRIEDDKGQLADQIAAYDPERKLLYFGIDNIQNNFIKALYNHDQEIFFYLIAAHETTHIVQITRGDTIQGAPAHFDSKVMLDQADAIHEAEAWEVAFKALSEEYPDLEIGMDIRGHEKTHEYGTVKWKQKRGAEGI